MGFIVKAAATFLRPLLWFSVDPSFGFFFFFFALREFDCRGVGVAWWVRWVWAWLIFFVFVMGCGGGGGGYGCGCVCGCDCCLLQKIYYFIVVDILF